MGALTSKPYAFIARPWELTELESIDIFDPFGSSVKLSIRGNEIIRVLPNVRFALEDEWISDSTRFSYDSIISDSRCKNPSFFLDSALSNQFLSSNVWFNNFLLLRSNQSFMPDHFCFSYLSTLKFIQNVFGFHSNSGFFDNRFFSSHQLSTFYASLSFGISNLFLFNLNIRYVFPTFSIRLRQIASNVKSPINIFNVGSSVNNLLDDVSLSSGPRGLALIFRCKSRLSRLFFSSNAYGFFDFDTFLLFEAFIFKLNMLYSVFHQTPNLVSSSELAANSYNLKSSPYTRNQSFLSVKFLTNYSSLEKATYEDVVYPIPHPYEDSYSYYFGKRSKTFRSVISPFNITMFPFPFKVSYYNSNFTPSFFTFERFFHQFFVKFEISFSNFFTHFFFTQFQKNSINILLNVKRHNEFRSNYVYYL